MGDLPLHPEYSEELNSKPTNSDSWSWPASQPMPPEVAKVLRGVQMGGPHAKPVPNVKPQLLLLTGLAIAESYRLLPQGSLTRLFDDDDTAAGIVRRCEWLKQRYGVEFPTRWLRFNALDCAQHPEAKFSVNSGAGWTDPRVNMAQRLIPDVEKGTIQVELLGQVYEYLVNPLEFAQEGEALTETASQRKPPKSSRRKRQGAYYTPVEIVDYMVGQTVGVRLQMSPDAATFLRILDPSCGGGIFLLAAYRYLLAWHQHQARRSLTLEERQQLLQSAIAGVDLDPWAVDVTRLSLNLELLRDLPNSPASTDSLFRTKSLSALLNRAIRQGNALIDDETFEWRAAFSKPLSSGGFDVVIGNPPYLDSEAMTAWLPHWRRHCTEHYQTARGNWDLFCVFIEKALTLCKPGGLHSFVVPNKLLSASYATAARSLLTQRSQIKTIRDYSQTHVFDAAVYPLVYVVERRSPDPSPNPVNAAPIRYEQMKKGNSVCEVQHSRLIPMEQLTASPSAWSVDTNGRRADLLQTLGDRFPTLGALAQVTGAATVAEAYQLKPLIHSLNHQDWTTGSGLQKNGDRYFRVVNSGTIDRYRSLWAEKPMRYLGDRISQPVISGQALKQLLPHRYRQAIAAKLIVASMTRQLEVVADLEGCILAGKSTCIIQTAQVPLLYLLGILNSRLVNLLFLQHSQGNSLKGGYLRIGPSSLRRLPIPLLTSAKQKNLGDRLIELVRVRRSVDAATMDTAAKSAASQGNVMPHLPGTEESCEQAINQVVYQLYELENQDILLLEDSSNREC